MSSVRRALWAGGLVVGVNALVVARHNPDGSFAGPSALAAVALLTAGWATVAVGAVIWRRRPESRFGALLAAAGWAWFVAEWNNPGTESSLLFTVGLVLYAACPPLIAHAALSYPSGRLGSRAARVAVASGYATTVGLLGLACALVFAPAGAGCAQCAANLVSITNDPDLVDTFNRAGVRLGALWSIVLAALMAWSLIRATPATRRLRAPVLVPALVYLGVVAATYVHSLDRGFLSNDRLDRRLWIAQAAALTVLAIGVTAEWIRARRARSVVARLVVDLGQSPRPGRLRDVLAAELGDPTLAVAYPLGEGRHVDATGKPMEIDGGDGCARTAVVRDGETVAVLIHDAGLLDDPRLVEEVASAARLAFENERLQAHARAQLTELRDSRRRLVATADAERSRLERDLHDGAQQRLVGLLLALRLVRWRVDPAVSPTLAAEFEDAEAELRCAVAELRQLASGVHPVVLSDLGLAAAIGALTEGGTSRVRVLALPDGRLPAAVETAAYLVVAEAAKVGPITVTARTQRRQFQLDVDAAEEPAARVDLDDRVASLDGTLTFEPRPDGGVHIRAEIPCG